MQQEKVGKGDLERRAPYFKKIIQELARVAIFTFQPVRLNGQFRNANIWTLLVSDNSSNLF